ncbi:hypothetical protein GCM10027046_16880 [Uliginosibacterium flavum]|uniref:EAL domain-containing protein n=1 Tax=Uliginosibacterium flavum TaxID=1396831 RepID=A0ABV2TPM4_9RHOO
MSTEPGIRLQALTRAVRTELASSAPLQWSIVLSVLFAFGKFLPAAKLFSVPEHYLAIHNLLEFLSMAVSAMVFAIALTLGRHAGNRQPIVLGCGFLAVCLIDFAHTLSFAGMPALITPSGPEKAINFWLAGRYVAALTLLWAALVQTGNWSAALRRTLISAALLLVALVWWACFFGAASLPRTFIAGQGLTPLKIHAEYLVAALYALAAILLYVRRARSELGDLEWLAAAAWTLGLAELYFTLYTDVTDLFNLLGHVYKTIAYLMVYRALFAVWVQRPYRELEFERSRLKTLVSSIPDLVWLKDAQGVYLSCNRSFERLYGAPEARIVGKTDFDFVDAEMARFFRANDQRAIAADAPSINEEWLDFAADGYRGLFETTKTPMKGPDGEIIGVLGIAHDITEHKLNEEQLRIAATAFESQEGMAITDPQRLILRTNRAFSEITGYTADEVTGRPLDFLYADPHGPAIFDEIRQAIDARNSWSGESGYRRKNGERFPCWLTITAVKDALGEISNYVATLIDFTERKRAEEEINSLAFYDPLTNLPNRRLLFERLKQLQVMTARNDTYSALMLIDLDNFKTLNDAHGHDTGDILLQQVAQRLGLCVRESDTVARLGGDEFVLILNTLGGILPDAASQTEAIGKKLLTALSESYHLSHIVHRCSASIGATIFKGNHSSVEELLKQADLAMYAAKESGRNTLQFFDPTMQATALKRATLEAELIRAVDLAQFCLYYQIQVADEGRVIGAEALIRWQHSERGLVPPGDFIPLAEDSGLILPLGDWVLSTACAQLARWARNPRFAELTLAVNLSIKQVREPDFVNKVTGILARTGANPRRLKLELTESLFAGDIEDLIGKMHALKACGVSFSLDDFGTGYSSLSYLRQLPLDQLKIDQSFVRDLLIDPNDTAIARTVVALADTLGLSVIAEGVETRAQQDRLRQLGCFAYQGYLFGRPLPLAEFEALVRQVRATA